MLTFISFHDTIDYCIGVSMLIFLIETNQNCNFACKYCFYNEFGRSSSLLTLKQIESLFQNIEKADFYLTGGEPFLNPEIYSIIKYLSKKGNVSIFTNASLITEKIINELLPFVKMFFISLDGFDFENFQRGHTVEVLRNLDILLENAKEKITIKTCLYGQSFDKYREFVEVLNSKGISHFSINIIGKNFVSDSQKSKLKEILEWILTNNDLFDTHYVSVLYDYYILGKLPSFETCLAGNTFSYVSSTGKLVRCPDNGENFIGKDKKNCFNPNCITFWEFFSKGDAS